jgi:hypothetical protein
LKNAGDKEILIPLGVRVGNPHLIFFNVVVKTTGDRSPKVIYTGLGVVAGFSEPLTMGLRAGEKYAVVLETNRYYVLDYSEKLAKFIRRPCQLWVELDVQENQCPNPTTIDPLRRNLPCWQGKAISNVLQLPN